MRRGSKGAGGNGDICINRTASVSHCSSPLPDNKTFFTQPDDGYVASATQSQRILLQEPSCTRVCVCARKMMATYSFPGMYLWPRASQDRQNMAAGQNCSRSSRIPH